MKKITLIGLVVLTLITTNSQAQKKYFSKNAKIYFSSKNTIEAIEATNKAGTIVIDSKNGATAFSILIKGFTFAKALMQQHFNENYMESDKFPKAEYKGTISNNADVNYTKDGTYNANLTGKLTIHGVTKDVTNVAKITVKGGKVSATCDFIINLPDYSIKTDRISKTATINVSTGDLTAL